MNRLEIVGVMATRHQCGKEEHDVLFVDDGSVDVSYTYRE